MFGRLYIVCFVLAMCFPSSFAAQQTMMMKIQPVSTPNFEGKTLEQVHQQAVLPGGAPMFLGIYPQGPSNGVVVFQSPQAGTPILPEKTRLTITLEVRPNIVQQILGQLVKPQVSTAQVPDLIGNTPTVASAALERVKLRGRFLGPETGTVTQQSPAAGEAVAQGTEVTLTLELPRVIVPSLVGETEVAAAQQLSGDTLRLGSLFGDTSEGSIVQAQSISAGTEVEPGTPVDLALAPLASPVAAPPSAADQPSKQNAEQQVAVPNLLRMDWETADRTLRKVGLTEGQVSGDQAGRVNSQLPSASTMVDRGKAIDLVFTTAPVAVGGSTAPGWLPLVRPGAVILGVVLGLGALLLGVKLARKLFTDPEVPHSPKPVADIRFLQSGLSTSVNPKLPHGPALRFALHIRERDHGSQIVIHGEPRVFRKE